MKFDPTLYNFASPFTGRVSANTDLVLIGDKDNIATPSPIIKHLRLDFVKIKRDLDDLNILTNNINEFISKPFSLSSLPPLGAAKFPLPNPDVLDGLYSTIIPNFVIDTFKAAVNLAATVPIPNPIFDPLNPLSYIMFGPWLPQVIAGSPNFLNTSSENIISSTVAMLHINTAQIMKRFDNANFLVKSRIVNFEWDNPAYFAANLSPDLRAAMDLYNLNPTYEFTKAQALDELRDSITGERRTGVLATNGLGEIKLAIGGSDYVDYNSLIYGPLCVIDPLASANNNKFISKSTKIKTRPNIAHEFGRRVKIQDNIEVPEIEEEVLDVELFKATDMRLNSLSDVSFDSDNEGARLLGYDNKGWLIPAVDDTSPIPSFVTIKHVLAAIATITALNIAYEAYTAANTIKVTAIEAKDIVQDGLITTAQTTATAAETTAVATEAQVVVLVEALETLTGVTVGSTLVNFALNILGLVSGIATSANLNRLDADTIHKASDYTKTQNIFIDQITAGVRGQWASGFGIFGRDTSLLLANDIHPVYIKLGGYKNGVVAINDVTDCYAIRVNFYNNVTVADDKYWRPKSFTFCHHSMVGSQQITDIDLLTFDRDSSKFTFHKQVEASVSPTSLVIPTILKANLPSPIPSGFFCYCPDF